VGRGAQGSLAHPACLDYRSRYPKALFQYRNLRGPRSSSPRPRAVESRVALLTPLTWITVLVMLPHPSVNGTSEEFISAFSTCGVRVCVCRGGRGGGGLGPLSLRLYFFRTFLDMRFRASSSLYFTELQKPQRSGTLTLTEGARNARAPRSSSPRPQWAVERRVALLTPLA